MKTTRKWAMLLIGVSFSACTNETFVNEPIVVELGDNTTIKEITVILPEILNDADTRTTFTMSESGVTAAWAENDTIGIFPNQGGQVEFPTVSGAGSNTAKFNGGGWGLKNANTYSAYYPYNKANIHRDNKHILLDYTGQTQVGNDNADHLGAYDYLASGAVSPVNGYLNLDMQRLGSIVKLELTVPDNPYAITNSFSGTVILSSDALLVKKANLDISGSQPVITPIETSHAISFQMENVEIPDNRIITLYVMLSPIDFTKGNLGISVIGDFANSTENISYGRNYISSVNTKILQAGKPYDFKLTDLQAEGNFFEDYVAYEICVANWDKNRDGDFSYEEAIAVTNIGQFFRGSDIRHFHDFNIFTGLSSIADNAFADCTNLCYNFWSTAPLFNIPETVMSIGRWSFSGCSYLSQLVLPEKVISIGEYAFSNCERLASINIPNGVTSIKTGTFSRCSSLPSIQLPDNIVTIGDNAFSECLSLSNINIPQRLTSIGNRAFSKCLNLKEMILDCLIVTIGDYAFEYCSNLENLYLPETISSIGKRAFLGTNLKKVIIKSANPPTLGEEAFAFTNDCPIYVPAASVNAYKAADGWSAYADRIQAIGSEGISQSAVYEVTGYVTDFLTGNAIIGAAVETPIGSCVTDATGYYKVISSYPQSGSVTISAAGYQSVAYTVSMTVVSSGISQYTVNAALKKNGYVDGVNVTSLGTSSETYVISGGLEELVNNSNEAVTKSVSLAIRQGARWNQGFAPDDSSAFLNYIKSTYGISYIASNFTPSEKIFDIRIVANSYVSSITVTTEYITEAFYMPGTPEAFVIDRVFRTYITPNFVSISAGGGGTSGAE